MTTSKNTSTPEPFNLNIRELRAIEYALERSYGTGEAGRILAAEWGVTIERARQIQSRLLSRVRATLAARRYDRG